MILEHAPGLPGAIFLLKIKRNVLKFEECEQSGELLFTVRMSEAVAGGCGDFGSSGAFRCGIARIITVMNDAVRRRRGLRGSAVGRGRSIGGVIVPGRRRIADNEMRHGSGADAEHGRRVLTGVDAA